MADRDSEWAVVWRGMVVLLAVGGGVWLAQSPLKSSRQAHQISASAPVLGDQQLASRLWQDPFDALEGAPELLSLAEATSQVHRRITGGERVALLCIMVPGGTYAEDAESRLRYRRATVGALGNRGYSPADSEHVGCVRAAWLSGSGVTDCLTSRDSTNCAHFPLLNPEVIAGGDQELRIVFEWFEADTRVAGATKAGASQPRWVLVWWLREEMVSDHPLIRLAQLFASLREECGVACTGMESLGVRIVGPRFSGTLDGLLSDVPLAANAVIGPDAIPVRQVLNGIDVFSCSATATDSELLKTASPAGPTRSGVSNRLASVGLVFHNFICTDDQLCAELVSELKLRGVKPSGDTAGSNIVLVAEFDTLYGRALPQTFRSAARDFHPREYGYLRGLDGERSSSERSDAPAGDSQWWKKPLREQRSSLERPEGQGQLDDLRRLAGRLRILASDSVTHRVEAIGVLGSDVPDKLLALQALRPMFPEAVFFTTDLDARLLHPAELKWTRNLIVASSYGLELKDGLQSKLPPFRDGYQTAQYLACLAALGHPQAARWCSPAPLLFEVGESKAIRLGNADTMREVHPAAYHRGSLIAVCGMPFLAGTLLVLLGLYLCGSWHALKNIATRQIKLERRSLWLNLKVAGYVVIVLIILSYGAFVWSHSGKPDGEPLFLFEGVSVWPTEILRMLAVILVLVFLSRSAVGLARSNQTLRGDFSLPLPVDTLQSVKAWSRKMQKGPWWWTGLFTSLASSATTPNKLWENYTALGWLGYRCFRTTVSALIYFVAAAGVFVWLGIPSVPFRGPYRFIADGVPLFLSVVGQVFLVFFVLDATLLCRRWIRALVRNHMRWADSTYTRYAKTFDVRPGDTHWLLEEWLDVHAIARRTRAVMPLIYYPFTTLGILIASRTSLFDRWDWPPSLIVIFGLNAILALAAVWVLRHAAEQARSRSLTVTAQKTLQALDGSAKAHLKEKLAEVIRQIEQCKEGAFAPLAEQPAIRAILLPFGGASVVALLDAISKM